MTADDFLSLLSFLAYWAIILAVALLISWLLSYLLPVIKTIAQYLATKLLEKSKWAFEKASSFISNWSASFVDQFKDIIRLRGRLLLRNWLKEEEIKKMMGMLDRTLTDYQQPVSLNPSDLKGTVNELKAINPSTKAREKSKHILRFILFLVFVLAVISINTFLMSEFWSSLAIGFSTYIPILSLTYANVLALLFAIFEVGTGIVHYHVEPKDESEDQPRFYSTIRIIVWVGISSLALVEAAAFARMSAVLQFATKLGISPDSVLYGLFNYFLAPFGLAITLILFATGYKLMESLEDFIDSRSSLRPLRKLNKDIRNLEQLAFKLERSNPTTEPSFKERSSIIQTLRAKMDTALDSINSYTKRQIQLLETDAPINDAQVWTTVIRDAALALFWVFMGFLAYYISLRALQNLGVELTIGESIPIAPFIAAMIVAATGVFGFFLVRWLTERSGDDKSLHATVPKLNRALVILTIVTLAGILMVVGFGLSIGQSHWITWLVGLLAIMTLFALGMFLRDYLDALVLLSRLIAGALVSLLFLIIAVVLVILRVLILFLYTVYSFLISPGLAFRKHVQRSTDVPAPFPLLLLLIIVMSLSCATPPQTGTRVFYLFDVSGSFRRPDQSGTTPLKASIELGKKIVDQLSTDKGIQGQFPQQHRIGYISSEIMYRFGKDWFEIGRAPNPFDPGSSTDAFKAELDSVFSLPSAGSTDIYNGLYTASEALKSAHVRNKLLIVFSDFDHTSTNPIPKDLDFESIKVVLVYAETNKKDANRLSANRKQIEETLRSHDCKTILSMHLVAVGAIDVVGLLKEAQ
jgi:hypothetical protein